MEERFGPEQEYSGRGICAWARVLWERDLALSQSTLDLSFTVKEDDISIPVTTPLSDIQPNVGLHTVMVKFRALVGGRG